MSTLKNSDPQLVRDTIDIVTNLLSSYGWTILGLILIISIIWNKLLSKHFYKWRERREILNTDPETVASRLEQMEIARRRQQQLYDKKVEEFKQKELEKELNKKQELQELQQNISHKQENELKQRTATKSFRDNSYNPLTGSSNSSSYRPSRNCGPSGG